FATQLSPEFVNFLGPIARPSAALLVLKHVNACAQELRGSRRHLTLAEVTFPRGVDAVVGDVHTFGKHWERLTPAVRLSLCPCNRIAEARKALRGPARDLGLNLWRGYLSAMEQWNHTAP